MLLHDHEPSRTSFTLCFKSLLLSLLPASGGFLLDLPSPRHLSSSGSYLLHVSGLGDHTGRNATAGLALRVTETPKSLYHVKVEIQINGIICPNIYTYNILSCTFWNTSSFSNIKQTQYHHNPNSVVHERIKFGFPRISTKEKIEVKCKSTWEQSLSTLNLLDIKSDGRQLCNCLFIGNINIICSNVNNHIHNSSGRLVLATTRTKVKKGNVVPILHSIQIYGEYEVKLHIFLTSAPDGGEWSASRPWPL
jgi:hypothetical protein